MTLSPSWTRAKVERRLIEAEIVLNRATRHPLQRRTTASDVPQHIATEEDRQIVERARLENLKLEEKYDDAGNVIAEIQLSWKEGPPPTDSISRAHQASWWIAQYVRTPRARIGLLTYITLHAKGRQGFPRIVATRLSNRGLIPTFSKRAAYRLKDTALDMIVLGLRTQAVPVVDVQEAA